MPLNSIFITVRGLLGVLPARLIFAAICTVAVSGCAPLIVQSPGQGLSPVNAVRDEQASHLMLFGHDVVSYFTEGKHRRGTPAYASVYKGVTFRFASTEHKALFDAQPEKYQPQFGGYCANGLVYGIPWGGDADSWRLIDGKLYMFGGPLSRASFALDEPRNIALAHKYWHEEVSGANAFLQRSKRWIFRVPHYRTGNQLTEDVAKATGVVILPPQ